MAKRARNGAGSIRPRTLANGELVYDAAVSIKDPVTNKSERLFKRGLEDHDAAAEWIRTQQASKTRNVRGMTLDDLAELYWPSGSVKETTRSHWRRYYKNDVQPYLGAMELHEILPMHIDAWVGKIRAKEKKGGNGETRLVSSLVKYVTALSAIFEYGVVNKLLEANWTDVSPAVKKLRQDANNYEPEEKAIWTVQDFKNFLELETEPSYRALWCFLAATGVRRGIACGLLWTDVHFDRGLIIPWTNRTVTPDGVVTSTPKGGRKQKLRMDDLLADVLLKQQARQEEAKKGDWEDHNVVFDAPVLRHSWKGEIVRPGRPLDPRRVTARFKRHRQAAECPEMTLHDLRSMWATLARDAGASRDAVADVLGHKSKVVTKVYDHSTVETDAVAGTMAKLLLG